MTPHQADIISAMQQPEFYPHPVSAVELRQTHISTVFLTGSFVYKIKNPVNLGFLDFSTLDQRHYYCRREVQLNRRLARDIYIDVVPITGRDHDYHLDGEGPAVEYAVKMRQLSDGDAMLERLERSAVTEGELDELADLLVAFYEKADIAETNGMVEDTAGRPLPWQENFNVLRYYAGQCLDRSAFETIEAAAHHFFDHRQRLFQGRIDNGRVKDCHGDLRSDHIYFTPDGIQIIDCIEFNDRFRFQDIISDLAFLAVDLEDHHFTAAGNGIVRRYVEHTNDVAALPLFDFYRCYRAMVHCKVSCVRMEQTDCESPEGLAWQEKAEKYLGMARGYAETFNRPVLWIVFGLPASGKSTIAQALGGVWGIDVLRSDKIRKTLFSPPDNRKTENAFGSGIYSRDATAATYEKLLSNAGERFEQSESVVLDATFSDAAWRSAALDLAARKQAAAVLIECTAADRILAARLRERETKPSLSDARLAHLDQFKTSFQPYRQIEGGLHMRIDTAAPLPDALRRIMLTYVLGDRRPTKEI